MQGTVTVFNHFRKEEFDSRWKGLEVDRLGSGLKELNGLSGNNWLDTKAVGQQYYDGSEEPVAKYYLTLDDEEVPVYATSREMAEKLMAFLEAADFTPDWGLRQMVVSIVLEESEPYYTGDKSLEEVTGIIQNRVQLLLKENM
ncbi:MAG: hypothetical protein HFH84_09820 [Lachnospiraceae bacterium]|nr:hypothetical protein [Lachnospiraceae bacterium]